MGREGGGGDQEEGGWRPLTRAGGRKAACLGCGLLFCPGARPPSPQRHLLTSGSASWQLGTSPDPSCSMQTDPGAKVQPHSPLAPARPIWSTPTPPDTLTPLAPISPGKRGTLDAFLPCSAHSSHSEEGWSQNPSKARSFWAPTLPVQGRVGPSGGTGGWLFLPPHTHTQKATFTPVFTPSAEGCTEDTGELRQHTGSGDRPFTIWTRDWAPAQGEEKECSRLQSTVPGTRAQNQLRASVHTWEHVGERVQVWSGVASRQVRTQGGAGVGECA